MSRNNSHYFVIKQKHPTVNSNGKEHRYTRSKGHVESLAAVEYFTEKMVINGNLSSAPVGIYTWIIVGDNFYATKVIGKQEIGTMHRDLYRFSASNTHNKSDIIAAGELEIKIDQDEKIIEFNFLSGTYHTIFIPKIGVEAVIDALAEKVKDKLESFGIEHVVYVFDKNLINASNFRASPRSIAKLNEHFNKKGGKRTKRNKTKKRNSKNKMYK